MELINFYSWEFMPELTENSEIKCPECGEWSFHDKWEESEVYCEDCGSHSAIRCPECDHDFDHVNNTIFETRNIGK